jgi:type II secretory pathway pseudopilin PulG
MYRIKAKRNGITLVEVMFAMGVALIGLVGLISVLPVAGRRTQDAINLNDGAALAHTVFDELKARGAFRRSSWRVRSDYALGVRPGAVDIDPNRAVPDNLDNTTAWCIDPLFVSSPSSVLYESDNGSFQGFRHDYAPDDANGNGYRRMLFPYYRAEQNPLVDPSISGRNATENWFPPSPIGTNGTALTSPFGSRMVRVGFPGGNGTSLFQRAQEAEFVVDDRDGIATTKPSDRTLNPMLQGRSTVPSSFELGKFITDGSLSWIATVNTLPLTDFASVAVVILRDRDRSFETYLNGNANAAANPLENAVDERLAYVSFASGFSGGAGGTVHIWGAANVSSELTTNDWVMLSRRNPAGNDIHRWYRILSVGQEADFITVSDPFTGDAREVWQHKLFLDGPDWNFGTIGVVDGSVVDDTYVTILKDVVAVAEHVIKLE